MPADVPLVDAMLCWNRGEDVEVIPHPDRQGLSDHYSSFVGACFRSWRTKDDQGRRLQLMVEAWHLVAFHQVRPEAVHVALLVIPEYRDMLADDCLPAQYRHERG